MPPDLSHLLSARGPWLHRLVLPASEAYDALRGLEVSPGGVVVRFVRATRATTRLRLFDECAAALQFPPYFGANWDAFHDCLADLAWLGTDAVVVGVLDAPHLLGHAPTEQLGQFLAVVEDAARWLNTENRPHGPRSFHVVLHAEAADAAALAARCRAAGTRIDDILIGEDIM